MNLDSIANRVILSLKRDDAPADVNIIYDTLSVFLKYMYLYIKF